MATVNATVNISGSGIASIPININAKQGITMVGDLNIRKITMTDNSQLIAAAADYTSSFIYVKNTSSPANEHIEIGTNNAADNSMVTVDFDLQDGEWAWFPWNSTVDLHARRTNGSPVLEIMIFER